MSPLFLVLALACSGGAPDPVATPTPKAATPTVATPDTPKVDPFAALAASTNAALADQWLVILASKKDPAEAVPSLETVKAHAELGAAPTTLLSSRFKNLMPCYAVTLAGASADKAAALALSKSLTNLGVDNYVKNAGAWVGPSASIDRFCAGAPPSDTKGDVRILYQGANQLWMPVDAPEAVVANAVAMGKPPVAMSPAFDGWRQAYQTERVGSVARQQPYTVLDVATGETMDCSIEAFAVLTLGTPHFGALQDGELKRPACGEPAMYATLTCPDASGGPRMSPGTGPWVATPKATPLLAYTKAGDAPELAAAAKKLAAGTPWAEAPDEAGAERQVVVTRWTGAKGDAWVVEANWRVGEGVCGGEDTTWVGLFTGENLDRQVGGWVEESMEEAAYVVDVGGDGTPELLTSGFPNVTNLVGAAGNLATQDIAYCDCPC